jgi:hypothetical protein
MATSSKKSRAKENIGEFLEEHMLFTRAILAKESGQLCVEDAETQGLKLKSLMKMQLPPERMKLGTLQT